MATTYDLELKLSGGSATRITGIASSGYLATGLTASSTYEYRVRQVDTGTNNGIMWSAWSAWSSFNTTEVVVPVPIYFSFNTATDINTASAKNLKNSLAPLPPYNAEEYDVELTNLLTLAVTRYDGITDNFLVLSGLTQATQYSYRIRGLAQSRSVVSEWGDPSGFITSFVAQTCGTVGNLSTNSLDQFHIGITEFTLLSGYINMTGTATHDASVDFSIEGTEFTRNVTAPQWQFSVLVDPSPQIMYIQTLDELYDEDNLDYYLLTGPLQVTGSDTFLL